MVAYEEPEVISCHGHNKYTPTCESVPCEKNLRTSWTFALQHIIKKHYINMGRRGREIFSLNIPPAARQHTTGRDLTRCALPRGPKGWALQQVPRFLGSTMQRQAPKMPGFRKPIRLRPKGPKVL